MSKREEIIRISEVQKRTGLSRSGIYYLVKKNEFPSPIKLGERASGFIAREVDEWIDSRIRESRDVA